MFTIALQPHFAIQLVLFLFMISTVKPIHIAPNNLSATFLAVRAQGGGYCGSFFVAAA
jgi:hypothetical protein